MFVVSQLARLSATERHQINLRRALVSSFVYGCDREGDEITFGRDLRVADAANLQQIVNRKATLLRERDCRERKQTNDRDRKETFHIVPRQNFFSCAGKLRRDYRMFERRRHGVSTGSGPGPRAGSPRGVVDATG